MSILQDTIKTVIGIVPDRWLPGAASDPLMHKHGLIGQPISRIDGPLKVEGKARFAAEVAFEDLAYAALSYSTIARGRIVSMDTAQARSAPGVILVMTHDNAPRMKAPAVMMSSAKAVGPSDLPIMQDPQIHWNGQPVALVLAETQEQADYAAALIHCTYEQLPAVTSFAKAKAQSRVPDSILGEPSSVTLGDAEKELADAAFKVDLAYTTPRYNHNAIELHAATVAWHADELIIHDATQMVNGTAWTMAEIFGLKEEQVRVLSPYVGGRFGGKGLWDHQVLAVAASKLAGRPVQIMLSREGVYRAVGGRTTTEQRVAIGANEDGTLASLIHTGVAAMTLHNSCPEQFSFPARHLYASSTFKIAQEVADMDMLANTFMRAPGESVGTFALECAIDELAEKLNVDPIELRRRIEPEKDPTSGNAFSSRTLLEAYRRGAERFEWSRRSPVPRSRREGEWLIGMGVATATYPYYRMPGGAARLTFTAHGRVTVSSAVHEMGMGTATVQAQHVAERLGLALEDVTFEYGDTSLPAGSMAGGSSQTVSIAAAVIAATDLFFKDMLKLAGNDSRLEARRCRGARGRASAPGGPFPV
jgi:xanthine dehydrogenase YagR molybdenum-binding subunit